MSEVLLRSDYNEGGVEDACFADEAEDRAAALSSGEDALLKQIEEFRTKAIHVQKMVSDKENKLAELEETIRNLEEENQRLTRQLEEKQTAADGIVSDVETQVDRMMGDVRETFSGIDNRMDESFSTVKDDLTEKIHKENVRSYRNIQSLLEENDHSGEYKEQMTKGFRSMNGLAIAAIVLSGINMAGMLFLIITELGLLNTGMELVDMFF